VSVPTNLPYKGIFHEPRGVSGVFVSESHVKCEGRFLMPGSLVAPVVLPANQSHKRLSRM